MERLTDRVWGKNKNKKKGTLHLWTPVGTPYTTVINITHLYTRSRGIYIGHLETYLDIIHVGAKSRALQMATRAAYRKLIKNTLQRRQRHGGVTSKRPGVSTVIFEELIEILPGRLLNMVIYATTNMLISIWLKNLPSFVCVFDLQITVCASLGSKYKSG